LAIHKALKKQGKLLLIDMLPHDRAEYRETMGHVWQGFSEEQIRQWSADSGFASVRCHSLPAAPNTKGPTLFVAVLQK
jgi:hypothetical protein